MYYACIYIITQMLTAVFFYNLICNDAGALCVSMQKLDDAWRELNERYPNEFTLPVMKFGIDAFSRIASELIEFDNKLTQVVTSYIVRANHVPSTRNNELKNSMTNFKHPFIPLSWKSITNTLRSVFQ